MKTQTKLLSFLPEIPVKISLEDDSEKTVLVDYCLYRLEDESLAIDYRIHESLQFSPAPLTLFEDLLDGFISYTDIWVEQFAKVND